MNLLRRALRLGAVALLLSVMVVPYSEARGGRGGGHSGRGHGASHHRGHFHGHGRLFIGVGPWWGSGWWYPPYAYPYYPYYFYGPYYPPTVAEPSTYIEREPETQTTPPGFWYYCQSAGGYYPAVQSCPESWLRVAPREQ
jgi:hypothetical protein